jgi:uncharacterized protein involved in exopolysaccharide biosynthesis
MSPTDRPADPTPSPPAPLPPFQAYLVPVATEARTAAPFTLRDLFQALLDGWKPIVALTVLGAAIGVTSALLMTPVYRAQAVVVPREDSAAGAIGRSIMGQLGGLAGLAGGMLPAGANEAETIATLRSRALTERFIEERNLLPVLFEQQWDAGRGTWLETDPSLVPTLRDGFRMFDRQVRSVVEDRKTGLVTVAVDWKDPAVAADWANGIVALANDTLRARAMQEATDTLAYLDRELARTEKVELRTSMFQLVEAQQKTLMLASTRPDYALRVIDPAVTPGPRDRLRPKRAVMSIVATGLGGLLGCVMALVLASRRRGRAAK